MTHKHSVNLLSISKT